MEREIAIEAPLENSVLYNSPILKINEISISMEIGSQTIWMMEI